MPDAQPTIAFTVAKETRLWSVLAAQREAFLRDGAPSLEKRRSDLLKLKRGILRAAGISKQRSRRTSAIGPSMRPPSWRSCPPSRASTMFRNLRRWMRPRARRVAMQFRPGAAKVVFQPLGVVGIISPWNYPASLCLMPLATAIAAGNRAMLKPSEYTPKTSELIVAPAAGVFSGRPGRGRDGRPRRRRGLRLAAFDHLVFTGSTNVGRAVMRAASANLVPVTLSSAGNRRRSSIGASRRSAPPTRSFTES